MVKSVSVNLLWDLAPRYDKCLRQSGTVTLKPWQQEIRDYVKWLMFQMASVGPMLGQAHHFRRYAPEPIRYAIDRYTNETKRINGVIDKRVGKFPTWRVNTQ
jgi:glutathione S-transferase